MIQDEVIDYIENNFYKRKDSNNSVKHVYYDNNGHIIRSREVLERIKNHFGNNFKISMVTIAKYMPDRTNSNTIIKVKRRVKVVKSKSKSDKKEKVKESIEQTDSIKIEPVEKKEEEIVIL